MTNAYFNRTGEPAQNSAALSQKVRDEFALVESGFDGVDSKFGDLESQIASAGGGLVPRAPRSVTANYTTASDDDRRELQVLSSVVSSLTIYLKDAQNVLGILGYSVTISNMSAISHVVTRENLTQTINGVATVAVLLPKATMTFTVNADNSGYIISAYGAELSGADGATHIGNARDGTGVKKSLHIILEESTVCITDQGAVAGTDSTAAIASLIALCTPYGRRIKVPAGPPFKYSQTVLDNIKNGISFVGEGNPYQSSSGACSTLECIATGAGTGITVNSSFGVTFEDLALTYSSPTYTGHLVKTGHDLVTPLDAASLTFNRVRLGGEGVGAIHAASLLNLEFAIIANVSMCLFNKADVGVFLPGNYTNVLNITDNSIFVNLNVDAIQQAGGASTQAINIIGSVFENLANGKCAGFHKKTGAGNVLGLNIVGNWCGDVTVSGGVGWFRLNQVFGGNICGNFLGTAGSGAGDYAVEVNTGNGALKISSNYFEAKAMNVVNATTGLIFNGNSVPIGSTGVVWAGSPPNMYNNTGLSDNYGGTIRIADVAGPGINFVPNSGATKFGGIAQSGNIIYLAETGVAARIGFDVGTGRYMLAQPGGALQTAVGLWACSGTPSNSFGNDNDICFSDGTTGVMIYRKISGTWTSRLAA